MRILHADGMHHAKQMQLLLQLLLQLLHMSPVPLRE
jgi:hypothetical protein